MHPPTCRQPTCAFWVTNRRKTVRKKLTGHMGECFQGQRYIISYRCYCGVLGLFAGVRGWGGVAMAKLSDLFGRKGLAGPDKLTGRNGNGGDPISIENLSDVGSRMGEENEVLRNLLTDTGPKIGELDDLKAAFDKLVAPFNSALRALEQEKSQTLSLSGML